MDGEAPGAVNGTPARGMGPPRESKLELFDSVDDPLVDAVGLKRMGLGMTSPRADDMHVDRDQEPRNMKTAKLGTLLGVYIPCFQNIMGIIFFIRLSWCGLAPTSSSSHDLPLNLLAHLLALNVLVSPCTESARASFSLDVLAPPLFLGTWTREAPSAGACIMKETPISSAASPLCVIPCSPSLRLLPGSLVWQEWGRPCCW